MDSPKSTVYGSQESVDICEPAVLSPESIAESLELNTPDRTTISVDISIRVEKKLEMAKMVEKIKKALRDFSLEDFKLLIDSIDRGGKQMGKLMTAKYQEGWDSGFKEALIDFTAGRVKLQHFESRDMDFNDLYSVGYEVGYKTKLSELAVSGVHSK